MANKRILIVDDEKSVLTVLRGGLMKLGMNYHVDIVTNGFAALSKVRFGSYDLIVTDYKMTGMDGLEFLKTIRILMPNSHVILITGYSNAALEAEARRLQVFDYITKPIEINSFRNIVQEALGDLETTPRGAHMISQEQFSMVHSLLRELQTDIRARAIYMTDLNGQIIAQLEEKRLPHHEEITSLLIGSIAALLETGNFLDRKSNTSGLVYYKGAYEDLYAVNIDQQLFLILIVEPTPYAADMESVWHFSRRAALKLKQIIDEVEYIPLQELLSENFSTEFNEELNKLIEEPLPFNPINEAAGFQGDDNQANITIKNPRKENEETGLLNFH